MNFWFLISGAALSLVGMMFHGIVGQQKYMGAIRASDLPVRSKSLSLLSWHIFTIFLFVSGATLLMVAFNSEFILAVFPIIGVNFLGAILFFSLSFGNHRDLIFLPGGYLMGGTAVLAWLGT